MKYENLAVSDLFPMTPMYFATTEILKRFLNKPVWFSKKHHQSIRKLHKWLPKRTLALDIESYTAMSDVFNRRWAMLPRSDRLIGQLENKSGTKKGKCRTTDAIFVAHFSTFRSSCIEKTARSWREQVDISGGKMDINMFRSKKCWDMLKSGSLRPEIWRTPNHFIAKIVNFYMVSLAQWETIHHIPSKCQPSGGWFGGRETPELWGGKVARWFQRIVILHGGFSYQKCKH